MAPTSRREGLAVIDSLFQEPYRFEFFQAVRVLERFYRQENATEPHLARRPVGYDWNPKREVVRFRAAASLTFPTNSIYDIVAPKGNGDGDPAQAPPVELVVTFLGMFGPAGVLPDHYTSLLISRVLAKDSSLRDFLDLFTHRTISLFYRAWEKYRFAIAYDRMRSLESTRQEDLFTDCLRCLVGLGTKKLHDRMQFGDESILYYAGAFSHYPRSAVMLERVLSDFFDLPITVIQFQGQWLYLDEPDRSRMPTARSPQGRNVELGVSFIVGERVWEAQSKFRLRVGPLTLQQFRRLLPTGDMLVPLAQLTRFYVGAEFDFDVQAVVLGPEVPWFRLTSDESQGPRLGWTTWARCGDFDSDNDDVVFSLDGV